MEYLIVRALQERRVDRRDRLQAFRRHAGGKSHRVLFGYRGVERASWKLLHHLAEPRAVRHRGR